MGNYFVYIVTNKRKTVYFTGMTNDLERRLAEHFSNAGIQKTFTGRYHCYYLLYYEKHAKPSLAIEREKEIKKLSRSKKNLIISRDNPNFEFLNDQIMEWPPARH